MQSNYKRLGDYIRQVDVRNRDLAVDNLVGLTIEKAFIPSVANTIGTDLSNYKVISNGQFACSLMQVSRDGKMPIAMFKGEKGIMSPAYPMFEVYRKDELLPEFLMMWFSRKEFDREVTFWAVGGVRGSLTWEDFENLNIPVPSIDEQRKIVSEYQAVERRIENNRRLIATLESTAQTIYRQMFVDNIDLENLPQGWRMGTIGEFCSKLASGATPSGGKESYKKYGVALIRSMNVHDLRFVHDELAKIDDAQADKLKNVIVDENDILFNITGVSVARCCKVPYRILPARVNQHVMIIRPKYEYTSEFLLLTLLTNENKAALLGISDGGSTREAITKKDIDKFPILIPHFDILHEFHSKVESLFCYKEQIEQENQLFENVLSLLLTKLSKL